METIPYHVEATVALAKERAPHVAHLVIPSWEAVLELDPNYRPFLRSAHFTHRGRSFRWGYNHQTRAIEVTTPIPKGVVMATIRCLEDIPEAVEAVRRYKP